MNFLLRHNLPHMVLGSPFIAASATPPNGWQPTFLPTITLALPTLPNTHIPFLQVHGTRVWGGAHLGRPLGV